MTAQVGDKIRNLDSSLEVLALSTPIGFSPEEFGITPGVRSTACWKGFWCEYEIKNGAFFLKTLYVNAKDDNYPLINGVSPLLEPYPGARMLNYMGHHIYRDINVPIEYTGKIIAVDGFRSEYLGLRLIRSFDRVMEWSFENGQLISVENLSETINAFREELNREITHKNLNDIFSEIEPTKFKSLVSVNDAWWVDFL